MKIYSLAGLGLGLAWGLYCAAGMIVLPPGKIIGEGEFYFIIMTLPLFFIGLGHSLILKVPTLLPLFYGAAIGFLLICETFAYRFHFADGNTVKANSLLLLAALALAIVATGIFYIAPGLRCLIKNGRTERSR